MRKVKIISEVKEKGRKKRAGEGKRRVRKGK